MARAVVVSLALVLGVVGCGRTYQFELDVAVTSAVDGSPIEGVAIHRNMWGEKTDPKTAETILHTDAAGRAAETFTVSDIAFSAGKPTWYLRVSREGFEPEIIEIKPAKVPTENRTRLDVPIQLRPAKR
jgi:hypothetical protein